ncbi:MAG: adenine phosphoribosyltransferase [Labilibaculum sp.]|nr:adenine phosphoribosyltransferase [Labilibaculum sp.]MBI9059537.1 adenine phosphoribosyltransferase [Labilibaculum sp.]|eukprot:TRINITY_DN782098_c0_g1_i1.p1 TRINITY_DN782098_c0_g1~~TRINITY_DN782098_c0_g1_i1.p1  ORF type:complete len:177 (-),score=30.61 TRINITY_DN782098_c0_g1_i1:46-576(-)
MEVKLQEAKDSIRDVIDFPKEGILFKDITTMLKDEKHLATLVDSLYEQYKDKGITKVVGLESRGFILGTVLAYKLGAGFVPVRKPGKLPAPTYSEKYSLEYGEDEIFIHQDALDNNDVVLLHDDLLATGGTAKATINLLDKFNLKNVYVNFILELDFLKGRDKLATQYDVDSLFHF